MLRQDVLVFAEADPGSEYHRADTEIVAKVRKHTGKHDHGSVAKVKGYANHFHGQNNLGT